MYRASAGGLRSRTRDLGWRWRYRPGKSEEQGEAQRDDIKLTDKLRGSCPREAQVRIIGEGIAELDALAQAGFVTSDRLLSKRF